MFLSISSCATLRSHECWESCRMCQYWVEVKCFIILEGIVKVIIYEIITCLSLLTVITVLILLVFTVQIYEWNDVAFLMLSQQLCVGQKEGIPPRQKDPKQQNECYVLHKRFPKRIYLHFDGYFFPTFTLEFYYVTPLHVISYSPPLTIVYVDFAGCRLICCCINLLQLLTIKQIGVFLNISN